MATAVTRPLRDSPVRDISPKEAKENLKVRCSERL